uniref:Putative radical SAM superfamily protein n=1 Tax=viral metagenome TaxID=1070528 RepID=A0A6M3LNC8_9ZZZZ
MNIIYEPRGKAGEYCKLACNLYRGCSHGCIYCYAPKATFNNDFAKPKQRKGLIEQLEKEAALLRFPWNKHDSPILLCFTCDPYQLIDSHYQITRQALQILKKNNLDVMILTKGGKRAERDFDLLTHNDKFGVTLTCLDNSESLKWESGAALPNERIESLRVAHKLGVKTWVSIEPVINPETSLEIIRQTHEFVDLFKVGKMNYHTIAKTIDWSKFGHDAIDLLQSLGNEYYIKDDLRRFL